MASSVSFDEDRENSTTPTKKSPAKESESNTPKKAKLRSANYSSGLFQRVLEASKEMLQTSRLGRALVRQLAMRTGFSLLYQLIPSQWQRKIYGGC